MKKRRLTLGVVVLLTTAILIAVSTQLFGVKNPFSAQLESALSAVSSGERELAGKGTSAPEIAPAGDLTGSDSSALLERRIIFTAHLELVVEDAAQSLDRVSTIAERAGGFIVGSSLRQQEERTVASVTLRIPARAYQETLAELRALALEVKEEQSSAKDVGEEYTDLAARLRNLEATEAQYLSFMKRAKTIDEVLKVQARLSEVREQIERVKGRMNYLDRQSELATISLSLLPPPLVPTDAAWDPLRIAQEAWEASLVLWQGAAGYLIRITVFLWWLPLPLGLAYLLWQRWEARLRRPSLESD